MLSTTVRARLRDPAYLDLHLLAVSMLQKSGRGLWYDSNFLTKFETAKNYLAQVAPHQLEEFEASFQPLRAPKGFAPEKVADFFDPALRERIAQAVDAVPKAKLETHEAGQFGRFVVHDDPLFTQLQQDLTARVSDLAARPLVPSYNFLSLYGASGVCRPHMDHPNAMYTLDYCIDQSGDWPIYFSELVDWPSTEAVPKWDPQEFLANTQLNFTEHVLQPNEAILFCGSSQWHYRKPIPANGFCNLLFMHYFPAGCENLVEPRKWHAHFGWDELEPLCDLFSENEAEQST